MLNFEVVCDNNKEIYKQFEAVFSIDLSQYQSRIYPCQNAYNLIWYYIKQDEKYIGSVWLEKKDADDDHATLGVFIAYEEYRNKGIGFQSIKMIIQEAEQLNIKEIQLRVRENNTRAIECYHKIGFIDIKRLQKENRISAIEMKYLLNVNSIENRLP